MRSWRSCVLGRGVDTHLPGWGRASVRALVHLVALTLSVVFAAAAASAQGEGGVERLVRVRVTSIAGDSIYFDVGRDRGLTPGLEVELLPPGGAVLRVTILDVSANSARARAPGGPAPVEIGTEGEVLVPVSASGAGVKPRRAEDTADHPPWEFEDYPVGETEDPLLAPAFGGGPASRPVELDGYVFGQLIYARDDAAGRGFESYRARLGTRLQLRNPFGRGGRIAFDGQVARRSVDLFDDGENADDTGRIDRLSYAHGDDDRASWRYEVGRFVSQYVPEAGLIDGVEVVRRIGKGDVVVGAGAGLFPLPFPNRDSGEDYGFDLFVQWRPREDPRASATVGLLKTWHEGTSDRDAVFGRFDWRPFDELRFDGSVFVDVYGGDDDLKDSPVELTRGFLTTTWKPHQRVGVSVTGSTYRWAQLLREDLAFAPVELVRDGHVERLTPRAWVDVGSGVRLHARGDFWVDREREGQGGEAGFLWRGAFGSAWDLGGSAFYSQGSFVSGPGLRARATHPLFQGGRATLRYEWTRWMTSGLVQDTGEEFDQHRVGGDVDVDLGGGFTAVGNFDWITGSDTDSLTFGLYVQKRF